MDDQEDFTIDPAIAAAMGFAGFGTQNKQKRKFNSDGDADGFVDPGVHARKTGANNVPVRARSEQKVATGNDQSTFAAMGQEVKTGIESAAASSSSNGFDAGGLYDPKTQESPSLEALRRGVKNVRGDFVYFSKGFLEDPWSGLRELK
ncbi:hypothetical protein CB0940_10440 [Cercospora beticola]|uniref:Uncharacterized protein n=1 Tax=Cercospora beticola TaxID=122368 RepID=A0A2G5HUX1_CERBT|nr:hypothetical protein CB0940_10440 [Cercospora beticola]PIA96336.1 hypothetical protein CB0940_10440 [Cercospora beticola]WPB07158.1 hypothetical protein RHO25_011818 [Cercospora beticola]CAK1367116.1 unnamed protein product [Cercospora beticola]